MPTLSITNNGPNPQTLYDQISGWYVYINPLTTTAKALTGTQLMNLEVPLAALRAKVDDNGDPLFTVAVAQDPEVADLSSTPGSADVSRWIGNHVAVGMAETNPTTPSVVAAWRVNQAAGEVYVDGQHFVAGAATDETGDASVDKTGAVFAGPLTVSNDRYAYLCLVNNSGVLERVFVFGDTAATGLAVELTDAEIATAIGAYLSLTGPTYAFVKAATILFEEAAGLSQTTTSVRSVPASY